MAGRRLMTLDVRELIRRLRVGQSQREIARDLSIDRKTVRKYGRFALKRGFLDAVLPQAGDLDLCLDECAGTGGLPKVSRINNLYDCLSFRPFRVAEISCSSSHRGSHGA